MQFKKFYYKYIIRLNEGEELFSSLREFCFGRRIKLGTITGVGAVNQVSLKIYSPADNKIVVKKLSGNFELAPLSGSISSIQSEPQLQLNVTLKDRGGRSLSGVLSKATVTAACEIIIDTIEGELERQADSVVDLNLRDF